MATKPSKSTKPRRPGSASPRTSATKPHAKARAMPAALVKRAEALSRQKLTRVVAAARQDIALIQRKRADVAAAFYDIGEALVRLKTSGAHRAFKRPSWEAFCVAELDMSESQAERLIEIVQQMTREDAIKLGTFSKASSVARLVKATPAEETVAQAIREGIVVGGARLDVKHASARQIARATSGVPRHRGSRGRHLSNEDATVAKRVAQDLERLELDAKVTPKAGLPGKPGRLVIDVAIGDLPALGRLLAKRS